MCIDREATLFMISHSEICGRSGLCGREYVDSRGVSRGPYLSLLLESCALLCLLLFSKPTSKRRQNMWRSFSLVQAIRKPWEEHLRAERRQHPNACMFVSSVLSLVLIFRETCHTESVDPVQRYLAAGLLRIQILKLCTAHSAPIATTLHQGVHPPSPL